MLNFIFTVTPWPRLCSAAIFARACSSSIWAALWGKGGKNSLLQSKNGFSTEANPFCLMCQSWIWTDVVLVGLTCLCPFCLWLAESHSASSPPRAR